MSNFRPVILCGGSGKRLWPLSRESYPKQFSNTISEKETMLETTIRRLNQAGGRNPILITNNEYRFIVGEQAERAHTEPHHIIIEPVGRNTAPAVCAAAVELMQSDPNAVMFVSPSDHYIKDEAHFSKAIETAVARASEGKIITFGIVPTRAETGYGYINLGQKYGNSSLPQGFKNFTEKPDEKTAKEMLESGEYLWNSGMFVFSVSTIIEAYKKHAPEIFDSVISAMEYGQADLDFFRLSNEFEEAPNISFDHAIMEHVKGEVVPLDCGWNDLGSWQTVRLESPQDNNGNATKGSVTLLDCKNSLIRSENPKTHIAAVGLDNIVAVGMGDAVLIADISQTEKLSELVGKMRKEGVQQADEFPRSSRPWGWFETLTKRQRFRVKSIVVKPGRKLSLQSHVHRAEHWVVVEGTAKVTIGKNEKMVTENESVFIPLGEVHRLENPGMMDLHLIEVQTGSYLEEDDIVRYEDDFKRT